jgi:hypothetical protein
MRIAWLACSLVLLTNTVTARADDKPRDARAVAFFEKEIRPVLVQQCYSCHSAKAKNVKGGLLLDTRVGIRKGGESGPAVVPGKPDDSLLLDALRYDGLEMPPKSKLPKKMVVAFEIWIRNGAVDPREGKIEPGRRTIDLVAGRKFWSFQPIRQLSLPIVQNKTWARNEIDRFLLARLEAASITPNTDTDKRTLLRRVYFDLIGLPPKPAEIEAFLADSSPNAFEKVVDRLLASRHFGERWGRHWLDIARFAESSGGGRTRIFHAAWRYRDYVIDSFNSDKPYAAFVREQIAGDLLPFSTPEQRREQLTATSFLAIGAINYELQDKELLDYEVIDEQLITLSKSFLGMTLGCARCHDHKFDPIPTRDYYAMAGIFKSTKSLDHANVSNPVMRALPVAEEHKRRIEQHVAALKPVQNQLKVARTTLTKLTGKAPATGAKSVAIASLAGVVVDNAAAKLTGVWNTSSSTAGFVGANYLHDSAAGKGEKTATFTAMLPADGMYEVRVSHTPGTNRSPSAPVTVHYADGEKTVQVDQRKRPKLDGAFVSLGTYRFEKNQPAKVVISNKGTTAHVIVDAIQFLAPNTTQPAVAKKKTPVKKKPDADKRQAIASTQANLKRLEAKLKKLQRQAPTAPPAVMSVSEGDKPGDVPILIRGKIRNNGDIAPRGFLSVATRGSSLQLNATESGRRQLADWMASPENPLTARVMTNRIWQHLFGAGLVRTPDNFGATGERPSHPELLDWLAAQFIADGWSTKKTIRRIVLSRAYRMSSRSDAVKDKADGENRLLWRANRRRIEAEPIRDAILSFSGQLDLTYGGAVIPANTNTEFGFRFTSTRRGVYVPVLRNTMNELFEVFDFADPNLVAGHRNTSTLPTQALYLMNSPFANEHAKHAAKSLLSVDGLDGAARINLAYVRALGRQPSNRERQLALDFIAGSNVADKKPDTATQLARWAVFCQTLIASVDFRYVN